MPELAPVLAHPIDVGDGYLRWRRLGTRPLPLELVIRELLDLDTSAREAVLRFVTEHGAIALRWSGLEVVDPAPAPSSQHLVVMRCMARHWLAYMDDDYVGPCWAEAAWVTAARGLEHSDPAMRESNAWWLWSENINRGLKAIRVRAEHPLRVAADPDLDSSGIALYEPEGGLYTALCVQLYNLAAEGVRPRTCASETCRARFVRQRGGAKAGQYRLSGVEYCSPRCARAQGQRRRRATMRAMRS